MTFPDQIFKAYDIRGVVGTSLTAEIVEKVGKALGSEALRQGVNQVVVGWDGRLTGPELANALANGFLSTGCDVIEVGQVPTPALYFATMEFNTGSGVMVTGSHNPPEYNGLKMMIAGTTLSGEAIQKIKQKVIAHDCASGDSVAGKGKLSRREILPAYCKAIEEDIYLARSLKLVIDCGNGVAGAVAPNVFRRIGCEVIELFCEVDGNFPNHHPDPSQLENLQDLIKAVQDNKADFGMAFDGDGDRLGIVSANGDVIWPDRQMVLFSRAILQIIPGAEIIFDVKCSQILPKLIRQYGGVATMWKTGHSFIKGKLKETGAALAGEMSGHIFFNDRWGGFDDGIYAGARLCELLAQSEQAPMDLFAAIPNTINTPELRMEMEEGEPHELIGELVGQLVDQSVAAALFDDAVVNTIDGVRVDFDNGFGLLRASNTTPTVIMRFEATTQAQLENIQDRFRTLILSVRTGLRLPF
ncbi:phosphomannomutase/phosphoglucomutase [Candidatus Spongiihabitans sp.]|uniref:phosphomannomutase/phosphoglucomutase n=1 Tax=Candidatus Spongiihabitans sp. TaxID=3101308 RepID=UPI003C6F7ACC